MTFWIFLIGISLVIYVISCAFKLNSDNQNFEKLPNNSELIKSNAKSWKCPKCGTENSYNTNKCVECGYKNYKIETSKSEEMPQKINKVENEPWECESCGTLNSASSKICAGCGLRHNVTMQDYSYNDTNNNSKSLTLAYSYKDVKLCIIKGKEPDFSKLSVGDLIAFKKEPENEYDKKAVAAYCNSQKIGYIYRGTGQDMTNDFLSRNEKSVKANISKIENGNIYYDVNYYKNPDDVDKIFKNQIEIRLVRNTKEEIQDYISMCNPGDVVDIDFDDDTCLYEVTEMGEIIGYIPDKKSADIDELEDYEAEISDITVNNNDKFVVKIKINY